MARARRGDRLRLRAADRRGCDTGASAPRVTEPDWLPSTGAAATSGSAGNGWLPSG